MEHFEQQEKQPLTKEQREAKKEKNRWDAAKALSEREMADDTFRANYERLKAQRLAREADNQDALPSQASPGGKRR